MKKKKNNNFQKKVLAKLTELYTEMEKSYNQVAEKIDLSCSQCQDNCCLSYFHHHTYIEWMYLWEGIRSCSEEKRNIYMERAKEYIVQSKQQLNKNITPKIMCPLNEEGLCGLYSYRLMICRLYGVPNKVVMPNGEVKMFPGCSFCQELTQNLNQIPALDRTKFYLSLAGLEREFLGKKKNSLPKVKMTLAEMIVQGPPFTF